MIPTLRTFTRALLTPDLSFRSLTDARAVTGTDGLPRLLRTSRFVEAEIEWRGTRWLLSMPLTSAAVPHIERAASFVRRLTTPWLHDYRILCGEMRWTDAAGTEHATDLVLERLPEGYAFEEAQTVVASETLHAALDRLETVLREAGIAHNNLSEKNLRWSDGRLVPMRYHDLTICTPTDADTAAFEELHRRIDRAAQPQSVSDISAAYTASAPLGGHRWTGNLFEGLVCVEDETGFGYVDAQNRPIIPSRYLWAGDFHEGRTEVETPTGMGLIDREGSYVITPEYEIVEYEPATSRVYVRRDGLWALFDYAGRQLTDFAEAVKPEV